MNSPEPTQQTEELSPFEKERDSIAIEFGRRYLDILDTLMETYEEHETFTITDTDKLKIYSAFTDATIDDEWESQGESETYETIRELLKEDETPVQG